MNGKRMDAAGKLAGERVVNHAVAFQPGLSFERLRHDINAVMSLPARPPAGMALMFLGFVLDPEALRRESLGQLLCDQIGGSHAARLR